MIGRCCSRLCSWVSECTVRPDDHPKDARVKRVLLPAVVMVFFAMSYIVPRYVMQNLFAHFLASVLLWLSAAVFTFGVGLNIVTARKLADFSLLCFSLGIVSLDLASAALSRTRTWVLVILALDSSLVFERDHLPPFIIPAV
eukprot:Hpha_TRINITY_DN7638_c0_g1::TRINITY_DN7638_c0_g1_i1::g.19365::m.19365